MNEQASQYHDILICPKLSAAHLHVWVGVPLVEDGAFAALPSGNGVGGAGASRVERELETARVVPYIFSTGRSNHLAAILTCIRDLLYGDRPSAECVQDLPSRRTGSYTELVTRILHFHSGFKARTRKMALHTTRQKNTSRSTCGARWKGRSRRTLEW